MKIIKNWQEFNEALDDPNKILKIRKGYNGKDTDVEMLADLTKLTVDQVIKVIRYDLKHEDVADYLENKFKEKLKSVKKKDEESPKKKRVKPKKDTADKVAKEPAARLKKFDEMDKIIYEMTGSPRSAMQMMPPKERTKAVFDEALSKHGYIWGKLNKNCDLLVAESLDKMSAKMKKAQDLGIKITTYDALIKKHKLFQNNEEFEYNNEPGKLLLKYDGQSPTTWFFLSDAILNGLLEEKLDLSENEAEEFAHYLVELGEMEEEDVYTFSLSELADMIEQDFEETLDKLFDFLIESDAEWFDHKPSIEIVGEDENGEEHELIYYPKN
ncbi:MAG: hypothetical protein HPY57_13275 [Ignavibacteria bacterium]|nr:hypothetical protein [Ignavibacteria bacterium]